MEMKRFLIGLCALCAVLPAVAQEERDMQWVNITTLRYAAKGEKDPSHALQQYLLLDQAAAEPHEDVVEELRTFSEEYAQIMMNQVVPEGMKEIQESLAEMKKQAKEHPELADVLNEAIKAAEETMKELQGMEQPEASLSVDPSALLKKLTQIAVNKKAYTGYRDLGDGLYLVTEEPLYGSLSDDSFTWASVQRDSGYTWGAINADGKVVIPLKYAYCRSHFADYDILFMETQVNGKVRAGAYGYDGRVRIPFEYDEYRGWCSLDGNTAVFVKGGKLGWVSLDGKVQQPFEYIWGEEIGGAWMVTKDDKNMGIVNLHGSLVVPLKYKAFWRWDNDEIFMQRFDGKLDVYNESGKLLRTDPAPKID